MDQETHDAAVRTVAQALQVAIDKATARQTVIGMVGAVASVDLLAMGRVLTDSLSPPANLEAKLEALPTMERLRELAHTMADGGGIRVLDRLDIATALHAMADLSERGKGAEAERLAPCLSDIRSIAAGYLSDGCSETGDCHNRTHRLARRVIQRVDKERAERFPGER